MIRVAIVGTGNISHAHVHAYLQFPDRCKIVALVDIVPAKAQAIKEKYGLDAQVYDDHEKILPLTDIDLVDVCTPPYVHASISINCLKSGKNVVCEKPMAASLEECDAMLRARDESGKKLSIIAQNRFRQPIADLKPCWTAASPALCALPRWIPSGGAAIATTTCGGAAPGRRKAAAAP